MGCFDVETNKVGPEEERAEKTPGVETALREDRKCKDVLFLVIYLGFLAGLAYVGIVAIEKGDWRRLLYGTDSNGHLCGVKNKNGPDFSSMRKIVYIDSMEPSLGVGFANARRVCASECPKGGRVCTAEDFPCSLDRQYMCPYYRYTDFNKTIAGVEKWSSQYYDKLVESNATATGTTSCKEMGDMVRQWDQSGLLSSLPTFLAKSLRDSANVPGLCGVLYQSMSAIPGRGPCYPILLGTVDVINRCIPYQSSDIRTRMPPTFVNVSTIANLESRTSVSSLDDLWESEQVRYYMSDVVRSWPIILVCGVVGGTLFSICWMYCLRFGASTMTFLTTLVVNAGLLAATLYCYMKAEIIEEADLGVTIKHYLPEGFDTNPDDDYTWNVLAYTFSAITFVIMLVTLLAIPRLRVAVSLVKVASQAIAAVPSLIAFPVVPLFFLVCFLAWWIAVVAFLWSAGDEVERRGDLSLMTNSTAYALTCEEDPHCAYDVEWDSELKYLFIYHLFGLLWASQFIIGFGDVAIAGAVARFYWCKGEVNKMPRNPVMHSAKVALNYHLGSIALGSFFIAFVQFLRGALQYVINRVKGVVGESKNFLFCCLKCCIWGAEKVLRFTNRNSYILVAVKGTSYCTSVVRAWKLVVKNAMRVAVVSIVANVLIWLGKLAIAIACGISALALSNMPPYTDPSSDHYLSSQVMPVVLSVIVGYIISAIFYQAYEIAIDTMLISFCEDCERSGGKAQFAPALLAKALRQAS
ncbi:choline transporter [Chloropicon primus]|uniref:Choline transporter-like protein n=1 Tax=Chloropicon primus TaxID=1764295 RepID=A0A5B8MIA9_9CHLO|nr:choline transporter [Chloropicon primus]UPQ98330.1 choline transporter [Chloropicon primus]|eukprot:QDZ19122.1 choline transporter [Chloropicon primus]